MRQVASNFVCLGRIDDPAQATTLASMLKDNGIQAVVKGFEEHHINDIRSGLGPTQRIELYVAADQKTSAQGLIQAFQSALEPLTDEEAQEYNAYVAAHQSRRRVMSRILNVCAGVFVIAFFTLTVLQIITYFSR